MSSIQIVSPLWLHQITERCQVIVRRTLRKGKQKQIARRPLSRHMPPLLRFLRISETVSDVPIGFIKPIELFIVKVQIACNRFLCYVGSFVHTFGTRLFFIRIEILQMLGS